MKKCVTMVTARSQSNGANSRWNIARVVEDIGDQGNEKSSEP